MEETRKSSKMSTCLCHEPGNGKSTQHHANDGIGVDADGAGFVVLVIIVLVIIVLDFLGAIVVEGLSADTSGVEANFWGRIDGLGGELDIRALYIMVNLNLTQTDKKN